MKKTDPFVPLLLLMILAAWLAPWIGARREWIDPAQIANWGVGAVFFFYGLKLDRKKLTASLTNLRLHALVQIATFVVFPLLVMAIMPRDQITTLWLGIFFVAALPSTVSSSVVMVSLAKGNVPAAIFNASISSLLGVALTPIWMSIYLTTDIGAAPLSDVVVKLILQVLLPIIAGMALYKYWGPWAQTKRTMLKWFDQTVILAIVWTSFCDGFQQKMFESISWSTLIWLTLGMAVLFFINYALIWFASRVMQFSRADRITALFCGSKKSLVHGTVMSKVLVRDSSAVSILLLPIMIYHALQLIIVSIIAQNMGKKA